MKYANNHEEEFSNPHLAFFVGAMQFTSGVAAEVSCIMYLTSLNSPIDVIIKYMALSSIALIDDMFFKAMPQEARILGVLPALKVSVHKRDFASNEGKHERSTT